MPDDYMDSGIPTHQPATSWRDSLADAEEEELLSFLIQEAGGILPGLEEGQTKLSFREIYESIPDGLLRELNSGEPLPDSAEDQTDANPKRALEEEVSD